MSEDKYAAYLDACWAERRAAGLVRYPDSDRGDVDEVMRLRNALEFIAKDVRCCSLDVATTTAREALK